MQARRRARHARWRAPGGVCVKRGGRFNVSFKVYTFELRALDKILECVHTRRDFREMAQPREMRTRASEAFRSIVCVSSTSLHCTLLFDRLLVCTYLTA